MVIRSKIKRYSSLGSIKPGSEAKVASIDSGRRASIRLADLGIFPGTMVKVIANPGSGPVLLEVRGSRYTLGRGIVEKIYVEH